jgi:hypothetical protein
MRKGTITRVIGMVLAAAVLTGAALVRSSAPALAASRPSGPLVPATGTLLGAYVDPDADWVDNAAAQAEVTTFESQIGRKLAINQHYYSWTNTFPSGLEQWDVSNGRTPLVTWEPWGVTLDSIISGSQDAVIRARANGLKGLGAKVFLRFAHEMNGNWYPWSGAQNGNSTSKYVSAYKHVHDVFESQGATNVVWVWSPNHENVPSSSWNAYQNYYPGDAYVDWVGVDGYNFGTSQSWSTWRSFVNVFDAFYKVYADRKPIMLAEVASAEKGGSKATWIASMYNAIMTRYPSIAAVVWFHVNKEADWRANSSSSALTKFKQMVNHPYFLSQPDGSAPVVAPVTAAPAVTASSTSVTYDHSEPASILIRVWSSTGIVRTIRNWSWMIPIAHLSTWDTRNDNGAPVHEGSYTIQILAKDGAGHISSVLRTVTVDR